MRKISERNIRIRYANFHRNFLSPKTKIKVVFDCSDGVVGPVIKEVMRGNRLVKAEFINSVPNGDFPAHGPNPGRNGATAMLKRAILSSGADMGVIFDSDGDRALFLDERGEEVTAAEIAHLLKPVFAGPYCIDVSLGAEILKWISPDMKTIEIKTGRSYMAECMRKNGANLGIENSGHYYFKDFFFGDSGILAAIHVINRVSALKNEGTTIGKWRAALPPHERMREFNVRAKNAELAIKRIKKLYAVRGVKIYEKDGVTVIKKGVWINARKSNTEPLLRINIAARDIAAVKRERSAIEGVINGA